MATDPTKRERASGSSHRGIFDPVMGCDRWAVRATVFASFMTDEYPPFRLDGGGTEPVVPAGFGDATGDLLGMTQDRKAVADLALRFDLGHGAVLSQTGPAVNDLRQF